MEKKVKLVKKVKRLLKHLGCPRWLHHFGPKTYEFHEHLTALIARAYCRLSYKRTNKLFNLLDMFSFTCPSKSALQYTAKNKSKLSLFTENRLQLVESGFGSMKQTEGSSVSSKKAKTIRAELYCKMVTYNLFYCLFRLLGQSQISKNIYKL